MQPDRRLASSELARSSTSTRSFESALARFEPARVTARPPAPRPILDVRARAIARAIEEELSAWRAVLDVDDARRIDLSCHVELVAEGERWVGHTETMGARGAFVATYLRASIGDAVELKIELPTGHTLEVTATVAGHRSPGGRARAGLQVVFDALTPTDTRELSEMLRVMSGELWRDLRD
ncbi:MAG: PilZ domain-containing protein [Deltaproteobacteria bacterium]|nr:PilZ domain-containing protein [Deltaproteobacteria bacterium]